MSFRHSAYRTLILATAALAAASAPAWSQTAAPHQSTQQFNPQAQASPFGGTVVEDIVARVNDQVITRSDYDRAMQQLEADGQQQGWSPQEMMQRKRDLLRDLVDQQLLLSKGKELGITGETELVKRLDEIRKQNHLESMEDLEKAAQQQGVSYEDFKEAQRNQIITQEVIRDQVARKIQMSPADVQSFYQQHKQEFSQPESVRLSEILIPVPTGGDANADLAQAKAKADDIYARLKAGASFEDLAKADSKASTAAQGGDLGQFRRGALAPQLEKATFDLQAGQFTQPIRTKQGFIILKVTQHTPGGTPALKTIEPQVEEAAFMARMQPQLRQYLTQLREQAYIDYKPGYVDSAAVPNSVKPLYDAYTPPAPKKAKAERTRYRPKKTYRSKQKGAQTNVAANGAPAQQVADLTPSQKPGKKEKIRYGQAPREALPPAQNSTASGETQVAAVSPDISGSAVAAPTQVREHKTRFSDRARLPKQKKAETADEVENQNVDRITPEELAAEKTQAAPLGLAGNTAHPKKPRKAKGAKTRYADEAREKKEKEKESQAPPQQQAPSPLATPDAVPQQPAAVQQPAPSGSQQ